MRDARNLDGLMAMGWRSLVLYECELAQGPSLTERLKSFLDD